MKARVFKPGVGSDWRRNRLLRDGVWIIDTRRACALCERSYRACSCGETRPCPLDLEVV